jgi:hypothetical protein
MPKSLLCSRFRGHQAEVDVRKAGSRRRSAAPSSLTAKATLRREWRGVKVTGHAQEVLDFDHAKL